MGVNFYSSPAGTLGKKYWEFFCRCRTQEIERGKAVTFDSKCYDWCNKENFVEIYDDDVVIYLTKPIFQDKEGNTVLEDNPKKNCEERKNTS
jgi:hypothetical protein